jgi:hypothetical protein
MADTLELPSAEQTPENRIAALEQEMKLLHWHKLANDAALKAALIRNKKLKQKDHKGAQRQQQQRERAAWMAQVIQEEQRKPLQASAAFIKQYEEEERAYEDRLERDVQRHIASLKHLKSSLHARELVKARRMNYVKNKGILKAHEAALDRRQEQIKRESMMGEQETALRPPPEMQAYADSSNLNSVVSSLDKLVKLERRVSELEAETERVAQTRLERRKGNATTSLSVRKSRIAATLDSPATTTYSVRERRQNARYERTIDERKVAMRKRRERLKAKNERLRQRQIQRQGGNRAGSSAKNQREDFESMKKGFERRRKDARSSGGRSSAGSRREAWAQRGKMAIGGSSVRAGYASEPPKAKF